MSDAATSLPSLPTRVLVVDDHPFFRDGLVGWLNAQAGISCCGEAPTVARGLELIESEKPDLVLLDLQLADGDGLELLAALGKRTGRPAVIVISRKDEDVYAIRAIRAGARGYVMKEEAPETLLTAIRAVLGGGLFVASDVISGLAARAAHSETYGTGMLAVLSNRELQVFEMLGLGLSSKAVAAELGLSVKTVDTYRESLKKKLRLSDGAALVRAATIWQQDMKLPEGN